MTHLGSNSAEQLPLFGTGAENEQFPAVSVPERAIALMGALDALSQASESRGYQVVLHTDPVIRSKAKGGYAHAMARAHERERESLLRAREEVVGASGYAALAESGLIGPDEANLAMLSTWAAFRKAYAGGQNSGARDKYKERLALQLDTSFADVA